MSVLNGEIHFARLPMWVGIPEKSQDEAIEALFQTLDNDTNAWFEWCDDPEKEGQTMFYKWVCDKTDGPSIFFRTTTVEAKFAVMHFKQDEHLSKFQHVEFDAFLAEAHENFGPTYVGAGASINLIHAEASIFDLTLGIGVEAGIGIKDETFELDLVVCGIMIGRRVGISVLGSEFAVDFGRLFSGIADLFS